MNKELREVIQGLGTVRKTLRIDKDLAEMATEIAEQYGISESSVYKACLREGISLKDSYEMMKREKDEK